LDEFFECFSGLSSDTVSSGRSGKDCFSYTLVDLVAEFAEPSLEENGEKPSMDRKSVRMG